MQAERCILVSGKSELTEFDISLKDVRAIGERTVNDGDKAQEGSIAGAAGSASLAASTIAG